MKSGSRRLKGCDAIIEAHNDAAYEPNVRTLPRRQQWRTRCSMSLGASLVAKQDVRVDDASLTS